MSHPQEAADSDSDLSAKMRDYLVEIYRLSERHPDQEYVSTSMLAELLFVTPPAVNRMVTRLRQQNLLEHAPYQGIKLTPDGVREARIRLRAHRIVESFLVDVMGLGWHEVYAEAGRMAANLTDSLMQRMWEMAGKPEFCPHGEPIPSPTGTMAVLDDLPLTEQPVGVSLTISRVQTRDPERLAYLKALGLMPGLPVTVHHVAPFHGPIQLRLKDEYRIIGHNLAEQIRAFRAV